MYSGGITEAELELERGVVSEYSPCMIHLIVKDKKERKGVMKERKGKRERRKRKGREKSRERERI